MDPILTPLVTVAEWTFLTSVKATVIIGLVLLSQKTFSRWLTARGRYALWFAVIVCLAVPFNIESQWSVSSLRSLSSLSIPSLPTPSNDAFSNSPSHLADDSSDNTRSVSNPWDAEETGGPLTPTPSHTVPWYVALWAVVGIGLVCLTFYNQIRYLRLRAAASPVDETTQALLARCREDMGFHRHVRVLEASAVASPSVFGCVEPTILLPEGLRHEISERDLRHVFLHELAHIKRHDVFLNWLSVFLQILHWFNPVIWFSFSRMRSDREQACDAYVLERLPKAEWRDYGNTLIKLTDSFPASVSLVPGVGIVESQKRMKARLQMIKRFKLFTMRHALVPTLLLALLVAIALTTSGAQKDAHAVSTVRSVVGVGPAWEILKRELGTSHSGTISHHLMEDAYPKALSWSDPGDTFVFLFAFDLEEQRVPEEFHDMLPKPWTEIERRVKQGETLALTGEARDLHIVLLAAPTFRKLKDLIRSTALLDHVRQASDASDYSDAHKITNAVPTVQSVVGVGPAWKTLIREVGSLYRGSVSHHTMEDAYTKVLSWSDAGFTFVLMFAFDLEEQRPPEEYHDMLPMPWSEIERRVKQGENLEMTGETRGLNVVLLAAPTFRKLQGLVQATPLLDKVRHGPSEDYATNDFHGIWKDYEELSLANNRTHWHH